MRVRIGAETNSQTTHSALPTRVVRGGTAGEPPLQRMALLQFVEQCREQLCHLVTAHRSWWCCHLPFVNVTGRSRAPNDGALLKRLWHALPRNAPP